MAETLGSLTSSIDRMHELLLRRKHFNSPSLTAPATDSILSENASLFDELQSARQKNHDLRLQIKDEEKTHAMNLAELSRTRDIFAAQLADVLQETHNLHEEKLLVEKKRDSLDAENTIAREELNRLKTDARNIEKCKDLLQATKPGDENFDANGSVDWKPASLEKEWNEVRQRVLSLESQLQKTKDECEEAEKGMLEAMEECAAEREKEETLALEVETLRNQVKDDQESMKSSQSLVAARALDDTCNRLLDEEKHSAVLEQKVRDLEAQLSAIVHIQAENDSLQAEMDEMLDVLKRATEELDVREEEIKRLRQLVESRPKDIPVSPSRSAVRSASSDVEKAHIARVRRLEEEVANLSRERDDLNRRLTVQTESLHSTQSDRERAESDCNSCNDEKTMRLREEHEKLLLDVASQTMVIGRLRADLAEARNSAVFGSTQALESPTKGHNGQQTIHSTIEEETDGTSFYHDKGSSRLSKSNASKEAAYRDVRERLQSVEAELESKTFELAKLSFTAMEQSQRLAEFQAHSDNLQSQVEALESTCSSTEKSFQLLKEEANRKQRMIDQLQQELESRRIRYKLNRERRRSEENDDDGRESDDSMNASFESEVEATLRKNTETVDYLDELCRTVVRDRLHSMPSAPTLSVAAPPHNLRSTPPVQSRRMSLRTSRRPSVGEDFLETFRLQVASILAFLDDNATKLKKMNLVSCSGTDEASCEETDGTPHAKVLLSRQELDSLANIGNDISMNRERLIEEIDSLRRQIIKAERSGSLVLGGNGVEEGTKKSLQELSSNLEEHLSGLNDLVQTHREVVLSLDRLQQEDNPKLKLPQAVEALSRVSQGIVTENKSLSEKVASLKVIVENTWNEGDVLEQPIDAENINSELLNMKSLLAAQNRIIADYEDSLDMFREGEKETSILRSALEAIVSSDRAIPEGDVVQALKIRNAELLRLYNHEVSANTALRDTVNDFRHGLSTGTYVACPPTEETGQLRDRIFQLEAQTVALQSKMQEADVVIAQLRDTSGNTQIEFIDTVRKHERQMDTVKREFERERMRLFSELESYRKIAKERASDRKRNEAESSVVLDEIVAECQEKTRQISKLEDLMKITKERYEEDLKRRKKDWDSLRLERDNLVQSSGELTNLNCELESALQKFKDRTRTLEVELEKCATRINTLTTEKAEVYKRAEGEMLERATAMKTLAEKKNEREKYEMLTIQRIEGLERRFRESQSQMEMLVQKNKDIEGDKQRSALEIERLNAVTERLETELESERRLSSDMQSSIDILERELDTTRQRYMESEAGLERLHGTTSECERLSIQVESMRAAIAEERELLKRELASREESRKEQMDLQRADRDRLSGEVRRLQETLAGTRREKEMERGKAEKEIEHIRAESAKIAASLKDANAKLQEPQIERQMMDGIVENLREEIRTLRDRLADSHDGGRFVDVSELQNEIIKLREEQRLLTENVKQERFAVEAHLRQQEKVQSKADDKDRALRPLLVKRNAPLPDAYAQQENLAVIENELAYREKKRHAEQSRNLVREIRYLRAKSHREAGFRADLSYQKKYLLLLIGGLQSCEQATLGLITNMGIVPRNSSVRRGRGTQKFRRAVLVVLAVSRMKILKNSWQNSRESRPVRTNGGEGGEGGERPLSQSHPTSNRLAKTLSSLDLERHATVLPNRRR